MTLTLTLIDFAARERAESSIITMTAELADRALEGASAALRVAELARLIAAAADKLAA